MATRSHRTAAWVVAALGLALALWWLGEPDAAGAGPPAVADAPPGELPPLQGERHGPSHRADEGTDPGGDATSGDDRVGDPPDAGAPGDDPLEGPVGAVVALDLQTVALEPPPGRPGLVSPQWSPDGKRLLAVSGKTAIPSVWIAEVDHPERGWLQVPAAEGAREPRWLDPHTVVVVVEDRPYSYKIGGELFALVDDTDEPGKVGEPVGSPDGRYLAYVSTTLANGGGDIRLLDRSARVVRDLTATPARVTSPAWRADGRAVVGVVDGVVTGWAVDARGTLFRFPRPYPGRNPGFTRQGLVHWQEGPGFAVNLVLSAPSEPPRIVARRVLASLERPAPEAAGMLWVSSLAHRGVLYAVRPDGSGAEIATDAALASQPDVVERGGVVWVAFTSAEKDSATARIHVGRVDPGALRAD